MFLLSLSEERETELENFKFLKFLIFFTPKFAKYFSVSLFWDNHISKQSKIDFAKLGIFFQRK